MSEQIFDRKAKKKKKKGIIALFFLLSYSWGACTLYCHLMSNPFGEHYNNDI
jgi:hypothetical protein